MDWKTTKYFKVKYYLKSVYVFKYGFDAVTKKITIGTTSVDGVSGIVSLDSIQLAGHAPPVTVYYYG